MLRSLDVDLQKVHIGLFTGSTFISTQAHLNVITHFLWEVPVEPRHPSLVAAVVAWTTSITIPKRVIKSNSFVVFPSTGDSRFAVVILPNKIRGISTWVLGTGTVVDPIVVIIRESIDICPEMLTRGPICDSNSINIVGVYVPGAMCKTIRRIVLVAPCLSADLAVADAVSGEGDA